MSQRQIVNKPLMRCMCSDKLQFLQPMMKTKRSRESIDGSDTHDDSTHISEGLDVQRR